MTILNTVTAVSHAILVRLNHKTFYDVRLQNDGDVSTLHPTPVSL